MFTIKTFLTNNVNRAYTSFNTLKFVSGKIPKHQKKRILDLPFLFTIKNVASGYTLCLIESCFFSHVFAFKL